MIEAGVYGVLHWTPDTFWRMSLPEYGAAMRGVLHVEKSKTASVKKARNPNKLDSSEADALQAMLANSKKKEQEA